MANTTAAHDTRRTPGPRANGSTSA
jgi:hypothetical protein